MQAYDLYADETFLRGELAFAFGALICSPARAVRLVNAISQVRASFGVVSEIKWSKTSTHRTDFYKRIMDVFFDDPWPRLSVMTVRKGHHWQHWAPNEEERFFKSYYVFLKRNIGPLSRFNVYLDQRTLRRRSRWETMSFLINQTRRNDWGTHRRNIRRLSAVDSRNVELVQLTDLMLGCATTTASSITKRILRDHFRVRALDAGVRIRQDEWSPQPPNEGVGKP